MCCEEGSLANRLFATEVQKATDDVLRAESLLFGLDNRQCTGRTPQLTSILHWLTWGVQNQGLREEIKRIGAENEKNAKEAHTLAASAHVLSNRNSELVQHNLELESENEQLKSARNELVDKALLFQLQQEFAAAGEETKAAKKEIERLKEEYMV